MTTPHRIPVTILAGFLGSGKTTRLNALLRDPRGRRIAVVLNELGEIGVDTSKLQTAEEFVELDGGCICCAINADLEATLRRLRARGGFDHLVIETTGIADPLPIAWTFERGGLRDGYRVDAIATLVDALHLERALVEGPEAGLQIERADVLLVSKLDVADTNPAAIEARLRALNPMAPILPAPAAATPWEFLLDVGAAPHPEVHDHRAHDAPAWQTWAFRSAAPLSEDALSEFLRTLPAGVYRAKGLVQTVPGPEWVEVHAVGGRYEVEPVVPTPTPAESVLVCIGRQLDRPALDAAGRALQPA